MYLKRALDPPHSDTINRAVTLLQELRALDEKGELSPMGEQMVGRSSLGVISQFTRLTVSATSRCSTGKGKPEQWPPTVATIYH
jgi:HrpA-like RNA helicase